MGVSQADEFIADLKAQSQRDIDQALAILNNSGPMEHVAWFCEQGFEKTVKYVYAYFKLKIQGGSLDSVHDKMRERAHYHTDDLVLNMSREIYRGWGELVAKGMAQLANVPDEAKLGLTDIFSQLPQNYMGQFDKWFDQIRDKIDALMGAKQNYMTSLMKSTEEGLRKYLSKFDKDALIESKVTEMTKTLVERMQVTSPFFNPRLYQDHANFVLKALALSPWVLPYAEMSRYPLKECGYENLKIFHTQEAQLRPYFAYLVSMLQNLQKEADAYVESLVTFEKSQRS